MATQPRMQAALARERPGETESEFGTYSSPPCFMHELDPGFLCMASDSEPRSEPHIQSEDAARAVTSSTAPTEPLPDRAR